MAKIHNDSILEYECEHKGKIMKDIPCEFLVGLYNYKYNLPKNLENWLDDNIDDLEAAAAAGEDSTLDNFFI